MVGAVEGHAAVLPPLPSHVAVLMAVYPQGSACAFTERILRGYGLRTGFYRWAVGTGGGGGGTGGEPGLNVPPCPPPSSPHLVQVRERIRINGQPLSKELFSKYFWLVYRRLRGTKVGYGGVPGLTAVWGALTATP